LCEYMIVCAIKFYLMEFSSYSNEYRFSIDKTNMGDLAILSVKYEIKALQMDVRV